MYLPTGEPFLGAYEILDEIGIGSFGRVYRARQLSTKRDVAIKVLKVQDGKAVGDPTPQAERFRREMRLCSRLSHPNIVRLLDAGEVDDQSLYAIFEFVPGSTLKDVLAAEGRLPVGETIHLMTQVLDALASAHALGIVHRDLKPENIMVTRTGARRNAMVLDFGLGGFSREAEGWHLPRITATYELLGTPCYAAPEQLRGELPSPRSDLYSWGLIFLECLTGSVAVTGASGQDVIMRQLGPEPVPIPPWLRQHRIGRLVEVATAKSIERRTVTVEELLDALTAGPATMEEPRADGPALVASEGERRQLTLVCCRIAVACNDGPPDVEEADVLLQAHRAAITDIASRHGGRVAGLVADRLLLVFGYPNAREHDARLAAKAAMRIVEETHRANAGRSAPPALRLEVRAGVHTGLVIVRDRADGRPEGLRDLTGPTPEVASRLESLAQPGEVLVSADVHRLLRGRIATETVAERGDASTFRLVRVEPEPGLDSGPHGRETRLVGRAEELDQLSARWSQTARGVSGTVLITGEPGIGKSRMVRELRRVVPADSWVECRCLPESANTPLQPFVDALEAASDSIAALLERLEMPLDEYLPIFGALLGLPADAEQPAPQLTPERRKELTFDAIVTLLLRLAAERPLAFVVEDIHWADPTSLELIEVLVREVQTCRTVETESSPRICLVFTTRPTPGAALPLEGTLVLPLTRLERRDVEAMVSNVVTAGTAVPRAVLDQVVRHADGIPLFVEEVAWMLVGAGQVEAAADALGPERPGFDIPITLRDLLASRLDPLSPDATETGQLAAALGREFRFEVLAAIGHRDSLSLRADIRELVDAGLLLQRPRVQPESYVFKHALVRDAAYERMTRVARQDVHERIADTLLKCFPDVARGRPEVLAQHFEGAGKPLEAAAHWKRSGDVTMARGAYVESIRHFQHALSLFEGLPDRRGQAQLELSLLESLGTAQLATQGYASPEVEQTFGRAQRLCDEVGEDVPVRVLHGIWGVLIMRGEREATAEFLPRFHRHAARSGDPVSLITAHGHTGLRAFFTGDFVTALEEMTTATTWYGTPEYRSFVREYGYDGGMYPYGYRVLSLWSLGHPEQAAAARDEMLAVAAASGNPYGLAIADSFASLLGVLNRDPALALESANRLAEHAGQQKLFFFVSTSMCVQGWAAVQDGRADDGVALIQQGLGILQMIGMRTFLAFYQSLLVEAHLARGAADEGLAVVEDALGLCRTSVDCFYEAELLRLRGALLELRGDTAAANASYREAMQIARSQGAAAFELRAAMSLARLGADDEGPKWLDEALSRFDADVVTPDVAQARSMAAGVSIS